MQTFREFSPTPFDAKNLNGEKLGISDFLTLPCSRSRDSGVLQESNFHSAVEMLGGESETVQVHLFNHWACGWFEIILVDPRDEEKLKIANEIEESLEDYAILDESDYSEREHEAAIEDLANNARFYLAEGYEFIDDLPEGWEGSLLSALYDSGEEFDENRSYREEIFTNCAVDLGLAVMED